MRPSALRRFAFAVVVLALLTGVCAPFLVDLVARGAPEAHAGVADYSRWGPLRSPVELKGDWRFVWHTAPAPGRTLLLRVPGQWSGSHPGGLVLPAGGAATYSLKLHGLPADRYTLYIPQTFSSTRVFVDGREMSHRAMGRVQVRGGDRLVRRQPGHRA